MLFLTDQDVYHLTIVKLRELGHDVITAKDLDMHRASDKDLLNKAKKTNRLLIIRDKDFGALIFLKKKISHGVLLFTYCS